MDTITLRVDGGSRGNPGPAGYGVVVCDAEGAVVDRLYRSLGTQTNNYAEYQGLLAGLRYALQHAARRVCVYADSELLVRQMQGRYKVRSPNLIPLFEEASGLARQIGEVEFVHVYREANREADRLANQAMDEAQAAHGGR